jgi:hypothetical protein
VRFVSLGENYDSLTATLDESCLMVPLKNLVNEIYARDISKKVLFGFKAKRQRGEFCGSFAPYGYIKEGSRFVVDAEAASVVQQIYAWRLEGMGIVAIAQKLNNLEILPPSRHRFEKGITKEHGETRFWYKSAVKRVLSNPQYTGNLALGRYKSGLKNGGRVTQIDESEWVIFENAHPAIIAPETFEAVRQMTETRKKEFAWEAPNPTENIFKGLIVCGDCGKHMTRERRRKKFAYSCYVNKTVSKEVCTRKVIREADLHSALYAFIRSEINLAADMERVIADLQKRKSYKHQRNIMDKQISEVQRRLEQNRRFRGSLREDFKDGVLTEQDYATMKADYDGEKEKLQENLDALVAAKAKQDETVSPENKWLAEFRRFETEQTLSAGMVTALVEQIKVYDGARIEVSMRYRDEFELLHEYLADFSAESGVDDE